MTGHKYLQIYRYLVPISKEVTIWFFWTHGMETLLHSLLLYAIFQFWAWIQVFFCQKHHTFEGLTLLCLKHAYSFIHFMLSNNLSDISNNSLSKEHWICIGYCYQGVAMLVARVLWVDDYYIYLADDRRLLFVLLVWCQGMSHCFALKINAIIICLRSVLERKISASKCCRGGRIALFLFMVIILSYAPQSGQRLQLW